MKTAGWYCPQVKKVITIAEKLNTKPVTVMVLIGWCQTASNYEAQVKKIEATGKHQRYSLSMTFDEYLAKYKYTHASRLF